MKLLQIKKKYPKAWAEFEKKHSGISAYEGHLHNVDLRDWYASIVDHFDKLGIRLSIIHYECDLSELGKEYMGQWAFQITNEHPKSLECYENRKNRRFAETAGLSKLFEIREKQLKGETK